MKQEIPPVYAGPGTRFANRYRENRIPYLRVMADYLRENLMFHAPGSIQQGPLVDEDKNRLSLHVNKDKLEEENGIAPGKDYLLGLTNRFFAKLPPGWLKLGIVEHEHSYGVYITAKSDPALDDWKDVKARLEKEQTEPNP